MPGIRNKVMCNYREQMHDNHMSDNRCNELRTQNCLFDICSTFIFTNVNVNVMG